MACLLRTGGDLISAHGQVREKQRSLRNRFQEGITVPVLDLQIDIRQVLRRGGARISWLRQNTLPRPKQHPKTPLSLTVPPLDPLTDMAISGGGPA
jgi:hypothetical protein